MGERPEQEFGTPRIRHAEISVANTQQHMEWLKANGEAFGGQYVALDGNQLVCTGRTFGEASEAARAAGRPDAFVTYLPKPDEIIETGGWL